MSTVDGYSQDGMSLRDWFAAHAPTPERETIDQQRQADKSRNPYNEPGRPKLRSVAQIVADLAYEYADAMMEARK